MNKLTKEQKDYQKANKKLEKVQQERDDALKLMQNACNHDNVACAYQAYGEFNDTECFEYRVCCDCGYNEQDKDELGEFTLKHSNNRISMGEFYNLTNR